MYVGRGSQEHLDNQRELAEDIPHFPSEQVDPNPVDPNPVDPKPVDRTSFDRNY